MYSKIDPSSHYDVEALLYVQEAHMDKFCQELSLANLFANLDHTKQYLNHLWGRERYTQGQGHTRAYGGSKNRPTCQLCSKYGHVVMDYWHIYDDSFVP